MSDAKKVFHVEHQAKVPRGTNHEEMTFQCPICGSSAHGHQFEIADHSITKETFAIHQCQECALRFTWPQPKDMGPYYDSISYISHSKTKRGFINRLYHLAQKFNLRFKYQIAKETAPHGEWLDYGCGAGDFLHYCRHKNTHISGAEIHTPSRLAATAAGFIVHTPQAYHDSNLQYDCISMWHVLEHIDDPAALISVHYEHLNPGGTLIIAVPNPDSYDALYYKAKWAAYDVPRHLWHFGKKDIDTIAQNAGFSLCASKGMPLDAFYISMLSEKYQKGNILMALLIAMRSNLSALLGKSPYSSQIYILRKRPRTP
jgi:SAM-dependent methyltransferase